MTIHEIIERNYKATSRRGLITDKTNTKAFIDKLYDELDELRESWLNHNDIDGFDPKELADVSLVCFAMAKHFNIDLLKVMEEKTLFNEQRED